MSPFDSKTTKAQIVGNRTYLATGPLLLLVSAVAFSTAGFFARSVPVDAVTMLFWRNLIGGAILLPLAFRGAHRWKLATSLRAGAIVLLSAFGSICFIAAFSFTSVANISIIYAAAPMLTAALAWVVLRERVAGRTLAAVVIAFAGVALTTFGGGVAHGSLSGDGLALLMTLALAVVAVLSREQSLPSLTLSCASALLAAGLILPMRPELFLTLPQFLWLAAFGVVTMSVALPCYLLGLRTVSAGRAMLISALELPLAPLWVLTAYDEVPGLYAMLGGSVVAAAIIWELMRKPIQ